MGKIWHADAVSKHVSTSFYGTIVALSESPKKEGLIYVGTDDGLIQITENNGKDWRKIESFPTIPEKTYVSRLLTSQHDEKTVYASFDNHKNADFAPYLLKSPDSGKTWTPIVGNLPANGTVLAIAEDHENADMLFVGTEFGLFITLDGGKKWTRMKGGLPTIAVRDLAIQKRENDLVVGTFGRGMYVLDDYSPLRRLSAETLAKDSAVFPVKDALLYIQSRPYGLPSKGFQGAAFYTAANPPFGATFTYHLKDEIKTKKQIRREADKKPGAPYPSRDQIRAEAEEEAPTILIDIADPSGTVIRTLRGPVTKGLHRVTWDLRVPAPTLPRPIPPDSEEELFGPEPGGPLVMPGTYQVSIAKRVDGMTTPLVGPEKFDVVVEGADRVSLADRKALGEFQQKVARLQRAIMGTLEVANNTTTRLEQIKRALDHTPAIEGRWKDTVRELEKRNREILRILRGDVALRSRNENTPDSITERVSTIVSNQRFSLAPPTKTDQELYQIANQEFGDELKKLRTLIEVDLKRLEEALDLGGAPYTPGRLPDWKDK
jgi:photosystem II stability/assembly factor-like uncharacterized protein